MFFVARTEVYKYHEWINIDFMFLLLELKYTGIIIELI
jgi:hypothetical protein